MEIPSQGAGSPFRNRLEKLFDEMIVPLDSEATRGVSYDHWGGENGSYTNIYKPNEIL